MTVGVAVSVCVCLCVCLDVTLVVTVSVCVLLSLRSPPSATVMAFTSSGDISISVVRYVTLCHCSLTSNRHAKSLTEE